MKKCFWRDEENATHINYYGGTETYVCERCAGGLKNQSYGYTVKIEEATPKDKSTGAYIYLAGMVGLP